MNINEFAKDVHQNAVEHGFWEDDPDITVSAALIHSEWSEALEEYRAGRPMVWYNCNEISTDLNPCDPQDEGDCLNYACRETCEHRSKKPEGIAVELIDGCIRILDYLGKEGLTIRGIETFEELMKTAPQEVYKVDLPNLVTNLHLKTSYAYVFIKGAKSEQHLQRGYAAMFEAISVAFCWIRENGYDPAEIMKTKHEYNRTRPYKHGGKVC